MGAALRSGRSGTAKRAQRSALGNSPPWDGFIITESMKNAFDGVNAYLYNKHHEKVNETKATIYVVSRA